MRLSILTLCATLGCGGTTHTLSDPCTTPPAAPRTVVAGKTASALAVSGTTVFYIDANAGSRMSASQQSGAVMSVASDGSGSTQLYAPTDTDRVVVDLQVHGSNVYILERQFSLSLIDHLLVVPVTGGAPQDFALSDNVDRLIAIDDSNAYTWTGETDAANRALQRIALANGTITEMTAAVNMEMPQFANDSIYYATKTSLGSNSDRTLFSIGKASTTAASLSNFHCSGYFLGLSNGIVCAGYFVPGTFDSVKTHILTKGDATGAHPTAFTDLSAITGTPEPFAEVSGNLYVAFNGGGNKSEIIKLDANANATPIACNRTQVKGRESLRVDAVVGDSDVLWVEGTNIFSAPR